jgi:copper homeostasis protein
MVKLEICAGSIESALNAQNGGADRIELCMALSVGGLTPSYGMIKLARELINIPIYVLIRPRSGDFHFSRMELEQMKEDILFCEKEQIDGVVIGALNEERRVDEYMLNELMGAAGYMDVTFHRAFDEVVNKFEALDTLIELGVQRILTSGSPGSAVDHLEELSDLIEEASDELVIMPGGGVRPENVRALMDLGVSELHSSCLVEGEHHSNIDQIKKLKELIRASEN